MSSRVQIHNRPEALRQVATWMARKITAGGIEYASGISEHGLTKAEEDRLLWAMEEVQRRLQRMGAPA